MYLRWPWGVTFPSTFFYFPSEFFYFPSALFYFPSPFFKFPFRVSFLLPFTFYFISLQSFLLLLSTISCTSLHHVFTPLQSSFTSLQFSIFKCILLSVGIFTSLPSLFISLQSIHNSFYLPSVFFNTL